MRALHVILSVSPRVGGPATALGAYVDALGRAGVTSEVLATDAWGPERQPWPGAAAGVAVHVARALGPRVVGFSPGLLRAVLARAREHDLLHVHGSLRFHSVAAALAARLEGRPVLLRPHGNFTPLNLSVKPRRKRAYHALVERHVLASVGALHFTSRGEREETARALTLPCPGVVVPIPVDLQGEPATRAAARRALSVAQDAQVVLSVGRIHPIKRYDVLVGALAGLPARTVLVVVGPDEGPERGRLEALARELGVTARVRFTGLLAPREVRAWQAAADVFATASEHENFGIAIGEACAAGLPCVVPDDVALSRELSACARVAPRAAIGPALRELLDDPVRATSLGAAARAHARDHWSPDAVGLRLRSVYEALVTGDAPALARLAAEA